MQLTSQQQKALDIKRNMIVTAGAGSGKTTILVERYLAILLYQPSVSVSNILALTFTDKAASEMKNRIVEKIYEYFESKPQLQERLFEIIKTISESQISTIHAFCSQILKECTLQSKYNSNFKIVNQPELNELLHLVFWEFFSSYDPKKMRAHTGSHFPSYLGFQKLRNHSSPHPQACAPGPPCNTGPARCSSPTTNA